MIELPAWAVPNGAEPYLIDAGGILSGFTTDHRLNRLGSKFGLACSFPPHVYGTRGRQLLALLIRAQSEGLRVEFLQPGFKPGSPGATVVNGNGQSGKSLAIRGGTPNYAVRAGQFLTHMRGTSGFLYMVDAEVILDATGAGTLSVSPMLREEPVDGDAIDLATPTIEGFVTGDERRWALSLEHHVALDFELRERK